MATWCKIPNNVTFCSDFDFSISLSEQMIKDFKSVVVETDRGWGGGGDYGRLRKEGEKKDAD